MLEPTTEPLQGDAWGTPSCHKPSSRARDWLDVLPPQAECLWPHQRDLMAKTAAALHEHCRIGVQSATGSGKTHLIGTATAAAVKAGLRVLILATRVRLVKQLHERLDAFGVPHGVIAAPLPHLTNWGRAVQVASVDTLYRRCMVDRKMPLPMADLVIFDEAHLALGDSRRKILASYPDAFLLGYTATPAKVTGVPLKDQFDKLILGPSMRELIDKKILVAPRIFNKPALSAEELDGVRKDRTTNDYAAGELSKIMRRPKLIGDVVQNWLRIANGKKTIVFACDKDHGAQLVTEFSRAGVACEQLTDQDDNNAREQTIARLEAGVTKVVVNCFLLSYGIDLPSLECVVLARPTRSVVLYLQAVGRAMRTYEGKDCFILIDHGRVVENLGRPTDDRHWTLYGENVNKAAADRLAESHKSVAEKPRTCGECSYLWLTTEDGPNCPECGWHPTPRPRDVHVTQAELLESPAVAMTQDLDQFFAEACDWYAKRWPDRWKNKQNSGRGYAWESAKKKFNIPEDEKIPQRFWSMPRRPVSADTAGWLRSRLVRWNKRQEKERQFYGSSAGFYQQRAEQRRQRSEAFLSRINRPLP